MKHLILSILGVFFALTLVACDDDDDSKFRGNNAPIYINSVENSNTNKGVSTALSAHEIVTLNKTVNLCGELADDADMFVNWGVEALNGYERDTINDRLVMLASNIIENEQLYQYGGNFCKARNFYFYTRDGNGNRDTLAYIPNEVIREGQKEILDLWKAGEIEEIYDRFYDMFYFTPCTAEEFKAQKEDIDWEHEYDDLKEEHENTHLITW